MHWYFFLFCFFAGGISFLISYVFLRIETKIDAVFPGKQLLIQFAIFIGLYVFGSKVFSQITFDIFGFHLSWFWGFILIETLVGLLFQVVYEQVTGKSLFNI